MGGASSCDVWFQYGLTTSYGSETAHQPKTSTGAFSASISSLTPGTLYHFRAAASNSAGTSYGSDKTFYTLPGDPSNLHVTGHTSSSISLAWTKGTGGDKTMIRRSTTGYPSSPSSGTQAYFDTGSSTTVTGLSSDTLYYFSAWAYDSDSTYYSTGSSQISGRTDPSGPSPPGDPSNLNAQNPTSSSIYLTWTRGSSSDYTMIRRRTDTWPTSYTNGDQAYYGTGTSTTNTGITPGQIYYYRAWAYNSGTGLYSTGYAQDSEYTLPGDPSALQVTTTTTTSISLSWTKGTNGDKTMIRRSTTGYPSSPSQGDQAYFDTGSATTVTGLTIGTTYYFRAWAYDSDSTYYSAGSTQITGSTQPPLICVTKLESLEDVQYDHNNNGENDDGDIFWQQNLGATTPTRNSHIADVKGTTFQIKATVDKNYNPTWTPKVEYTWSLNGKSGSGNFDGYSGTTTAITTPNNVGNYTLSITFKIKDNNNQVKWSKTFTPYVYVTFAAPTAKGWYVKEGAIYHYMGVKSNLVRPAYIDLATRWANGLSDDNVIVKTITEKITNTPRWRYQAGSTNEYTAHNLITRYISNPSNSVNEEGSCGAFHEVLQFLAATLGIDVGEQDLYNKLSSNCYLNLDNDEDPEVTITNQEMDAAFLTKTPCIALDGDSGNAYQTTWMNKDRWDFHDHVYGIYNGKGYDPTFRVTQGFSVTDPWINVDSRAYWEMWKGEFIDTDGDGIKDTYNILGYDIAYSGTSGNQRKITSELDFAHFGKWGKFKYESHTPPPIENNSIEKDSRVKPLTSNGTQITNYFLDYGVDNDNNSLYNYLIYEFKVNISTPGYYVIETTLTLNRTRCIFPEYSSLKPSLRIIKYLTSGIHQMNFSILGKDIFDNKINGIYHPIITLRDEHYDVIDQKIFNTSYYHFSDFQGILIKPLTIDDYGNDTGSDGLFNYLTIELNTNTVIAGTYTIGGTLYNSSGKLIDTKVEAFNLSQGNNTIYFNIDGPKIYQQRINGPYNLSLSLSDHKYEENINYVTSQYNYSDFQRPKSYLNETFSDYGVDGDNDTKYDYLSIKADVHVNTTGTYQLIGTLYDTTQKEITSTLTVTNLSTTSNNITLRFNGSHIYENAINGPYTLQSIIFLDSNGDIIDSLNNCYTTAFYDYHAFDIPPTNAPTTPSMPSGPSQGFLHTIYSFTTSAIDPDNDTIQYGWDMNGDHIIDDWTMFYPSGNLITFNYTWHSPGTYNISVKAADKYSVKSNWSASWSVHINSPPNADFITTPEFPTDLITIHFNSTATDDDGVIVSWRWDFGDGSNSTNQNSTHRYADDGLYKVELTVYDNRGQSDNITKFIEVLNVAPTANYRYNASFRGSLNVSFHDNSTDPDGTIISWYWLFGDGNHSTIRNPTHLYSNFGRYNVTLIVWDDDGSFDDITKNITLVNAPPYNPHTPNPTNGTTGVNPNTTINWQGGDPDPGDTVTYDVYFGVTNPPPKVISNQSTTTYTPGTMNYGIIYYWKIIPWDNYHEPAQTIPIWHFTTNYRPYQPHNPFPPDESVNVSNEVTLSWIGGDPDSSDIVTYDVCFGTSNPPPHVVSNQTGTSYDPGILLNLTTYYWKIVPWDNHGVSNVSVVWSFTTSPPDHAPYPPSNPFPPDGATGVLPNITLSWEGGDPDPGDAVTYDVYLGVTSPPPLIAHNITNTSFAAINLNTGVLYNWRIVAWDFYHKKASSLNWSFTINKAPIVGDILYQNPSWWLPNETYSCLIQATDPESDNISYLVDWGDGTTTDWTEWCHSGDDKILTHSWNGEQIYSVSVKSRDSKGAESNFSEIIQVNVKHVDTYYRMFIVGALTDERSVGDWDYYRILKIVYVRFSGGGPGQLISFNSSSYPEELLVRHGKRPGLIVDLKTNFLIFGLFKSVIVSEIPKSHLTIQPPPTEHKEMPTKNNTGQVSQQY